MNDQQLATTLAALRQFQRTGPDAEFADYFTEHAPLTAAEIDVLVDQLNIAPVPPRALVVVEGGIVTGVYCTAPVEVCVKDFDCIKELGVEWSAAFSEGELLDNAAFSAALHADTAQSSSDDMTVDAFGGGDGIAVGNAGDDDDEPEAS